LPTMASVALPCPTHLIANATGIAASTPPIAPPGAKGPYIGVEQRGRTWTVKADTLPAAPAYATDRNVSTAIRAAMLTPARAIGPEGGMGPIYFTLNGLPNENAARGPAADPPVRCPLARKPAQRAGDCFGSTGGQFSTGVSPVRWDEAERRGLIARAPALLDSVRCHVRALLVQCAQLHGSHLLSFTTWTGASEGLGRAPVVGRSVRGTSGG
jgi:hypothetical protein